MRVLRRIYLDVRHAFLDQFQKFTTNDRGKVMRERGPCGVNFVRHPFIVKTTGLDTVIL